MNRYYRLQFMCVCVCIFILKRCSKEFTLNPIYNRYIYFAYFSSYRIDYVRYTRRRLTLVWLALRRDRVFSNNILTTRVLFRIRQDEKTCRYIIT